jgi:putative transposase
MDRVRGESKLGVNDFLRLSGIAKSSYYRKKRVSRKPGKQRVSLLERSVKRLCDKHPRLGYRPIHSLLTTERGRAGSVYRIMKRLELCQPASVKRKVKSQVAGTDLEKGGVTIGLDFTHGQKQPIWNVIEYQSRYSLATVATGQETALTAKEALRQALHEAKRLGLPHEQLEVKSDHGSTFTAATFSDFLSQHQGLPTLSAVGRPQGMGRVERYNRSLKEQGLQFEDTNEHESLQPSLNRYRRYYNKKRPHQALNYQTPFQIIQQLQQDNPAKKSRSKVAKNSTQVVP